jgi:uncharacterized protein
MSDPNSQSLLPNWSATLPSRIEVVFKVAERCNINCRYCYVFNGLDDSYRNHPALIPDRVVDGVAAFLRQGAEKLALKSVQVDFHGGEPLLLGKRRFDEICRKFKAAFAGSETALVLAVQTNATLVDREWVELFIRHDLRIGVSIDGPPEYNDLDRVDFKGRGTYADVRRGLDLLREAVQKGGLKNIGALCVVNPAFSAPRILSHLVDELGLEALDFLLPNLTHDTAGPLQQERYAEYLTSLWDEWTARDDPRIEVRLLNSVLALLLGGSSKVTGFGLALAPAITISSDGSLGPDDLLRSCGAPMMSGYGTEFDSSLESFLKGPRMGQLFRDLGKLSGECLDCCWLKACGGGTIVNRYRSETRFQNPSVFCGSLKALFVRASNYLLALGLPEGHLVNSLAVTAAPSAAGLGPDA